MSESSILKTQYVSVKTKCNIQMLDVKCSFLSHDVNPQCLTVFDRMSLYAHYNISQKAGNQLLDFAY